MQSLPRWALPVTLPMHKHEPTASLLDNSDGPRKLLRWVLFFWYYKQLPGRFKLALAGRQELLDAKTLFNRTHVLVRDRPRRWMCN